MLLGVLLACATIVKSDVPDPEEVFRWRPPTAAEWVMFGAYSGLVVTDVLQTRAFLKDPAKYETNPLLGPHPSELRLYLTAGAGLLLVGAGWYFLPPPWRSIVLLIPMVIEGRVVVMNF